MSDHKDQDGAGMKKAGLSEEARELAEEIMAEGGLNSESKDRAERERLAENASTGSDDTLRQVHRKFVEILSSIEESVNESYSAIDKKVDQVISTLTKELQAIGLGVFATRAASTVKVRLREDLKPSEQLELISKRLSDARERLDSMVLTTSSGLTLQIFQTAAQQQDRLVQLYARANELDKQLENSVADGKIWQSRVSELEEVLRLKDSALDQASNNIEDLRTMVSELRANLDDKSAEIADLKGMVGQAQIRMNEQQGLLSRLGTTEEIVQQYESRVEELASIRGHIMVLEDKLAQRDAAIALLKKETAEHEEKEKVLESELERMQYEAAEWMGQRDAQSAEAQKLQARIKEMENRWDALYQIAEDEPAFKAYFIIAGKTNWFPLQHLSSALGIPTILMKRQLQKFIDAGLVEIDEDRIRPKTLSEASIQQVSPRDDSLEDET